ncbi:hypothetical protein J3458_019517 [Metarhizium acridum]|uniref:uncharacterized protein n=1 Tax=Metarhizium acridum TaxID=92637 RepID=UPI001C6AF633|nr:hypothetical protein J3458_019517 [Metarhizium acridum]
MTVEGSIQILGGSEAVSQNETESYRVLNEAEITVVFDKLVDAGVIKYDYTYTTENRKIGGLDFEFRISKVLNSKPNNPKSPPNTRNGTVALKQRPGSDINTQGSEITRLGENHFLAFNGFACYRPHFLVLTLDGHRRQWEPLNMDDFRAVDAFLGAYGKDNLVLFNGGAEAGCSRLHKHLQAIPKQSFDGNPWRNLDCNSDALPFVYFEQKLKLNSSPQETLEVYKAGLAFVEHTLGCETAEQNRAPPHNVVMDRERMVVIPRRAAGNGLVGANAAGMLGMIWTQSEETMQLWLDAGPPVVLEQVGFPRLF